MVEIKIPMHIEFALSKLHSAGYEAYIVGGCVRDSIIGQPPKDWDLCTSALPEQIAEVFTDLEVIATDIVYGTVIVVFENNNCKHCVEITTYRTDGEYKDNRHPEKVKFVSDLSLDLMRRDFTINAMAYNSKDGLIDRFNGVNDIKKGYLRCVGNPDDRFQEDALRIMRAIRFAIKYNLKIDDEVVSSIKLNKSLLKNISIERISSELSKILELDLTYDKNSKNNKVELIGYLIEVLREIIDFGTAIDNTKIYERLSMVEPNVCLRLAILFDNTNLLSILKDLRFSNDIIFTTQAIREYGHRIIEDKEIWSSQESVLSTINELNIGSEKHDVNNNGMLRYYARKLLLNLNSYPFELVILFAKTHTKDEYTLLSLELLRKQLEYSKKNDVYCLKYLAINGDDLMKLGYKGKEIGYILNNLLELVMKEEVKNNKEDLKLVMSGMEIENEFQM